MTLHIQDFSRMPIPFDSQLLTLLRCPVSGTRVQIDNNNLVNVDGSQSYTIDDVGVPLFAEEFLSDDAKAQQRHYDRIAAQYSENMTYPHTQEYLAHLDKALFRIIGPKPLGILAELCCGSGEAVRTLGGSYEKAVGIDISRQMLDIGRVEITDPHVAMIQGDATRLPLASGAFDSVVMLGGIHHVNDRQTLFSEAFRILKPGGRFIWREPVDDFSLWRLIRKIVYRFSPALDHETERPLRYHDTVPLLERAGFHLSDWETVGFLGFCFFMNSDVLVFNRLFRFVPGIRAITRFSAAVDDMMTGLPGMSRKGLIVVGSATKIA